LFEAETDPEAQLIDTRLEAIRSLENNILSLREGRAKIVQETLISAGDDKEAREKIYSELDNYDAQEKSLLNNLKWGLAKLEILRKYDADVEKAEDGTSIQLPRRSNPDFTIKSPTPTKATEDGESEIQLGSTDTSRRSSLFAALRRLLHSQPMEEITVFPAGLISDTNGRADSFDVVNAWLFHHLRTSDDELKTYVDCLTRKPDLSKILSPEEILRHALQEWYNDITFKAHQADHNTTNMTLGGDYSRVPFSTATSLKHGFGGQQRSRDRRQRAQPPLTPGAIRMAPLQPNNGNEEG
jgi:hypothetical protein